MGYLCWKWQEGERDGEEKGGEEKGREERGDPGDTPIDGSFSSSAAAAQQCPASRLPVYSSGSAHGGGGLDPAEGLGCR